MAYLLDTSILFRLVNTLDPQHQTARTALATLHNRSELLYITAQNLIEFRNGTTRPLQNNGLGLSPTVAAAEAVKFELAFPMLPDNAAIYPAWKALADAAGVSGKQAHDTRLVAVCHVHEITHLLTFNVRDFLRFQSLGPGLVVVDPNTV